jgi:AraC family transcriptional regulator
MAPTRDGQLSSAPICIAGSAGETFGQVLRTRETGGFLLRESRYAPGVRMPAHYHPRAYFSFVVGGALHESVRRGDHVYAAGSLHAHEPGDPHAGEAGRTGLVCLSLVPLGASQEALRRHPPPAGVLDPSIALLAARGHHEMEERDAASDLALEGLVLELVAAVLRARPSHEARMPRWLRDVRDHLHDRAGERVDLARLAALARVHPVHLVRAFRRHLGVTPAGYQRRLRIERARRALVESDTPIAELALDSGFAGQAHFTHWFRRLVGVTPAAYRRAHRCRGRF